MSDHRLSQEAASARRGGHPLEDWFIVHTDDREFVFENDDGVARLRWFGVNNEQTHIRIEDSNSVTVPSTVVEAALRNETVRRVAGQTDEPAQTGVTAFAEK